MMTDVVSQDAGESYFRILSWQGLGLFLISGATLCFEINLTRLFSVSQFYHFAFLVVSIALLGSGASGTFLVLKKRHEEGYERRLLPWLAAGSGISILGAYLLVNWLPFDSYSMFVDPQQTIILLGHYAALAAPFFFSGIVTSLLLQMHRTSEGRVYAVNLTGSAVGCLMAILTPALVDGEGLVALSSGLAALSILFFLQGGQYIRKNSKPGRFGIWGILVILMMLNAILLGWRVTTGNFPVFFGLNLSPYKGISYALQSPEARLFSSKWNSFSRVDIVSSPSLHSVPGLSYRYREILPEIQGLFVDGDNMNAIFPEDAPFDFADYLPAAVAFHLHPGAATLILDPKGGMDIQVAQALGAGGITVTEGNSLVIQASPGAYFNEQVRLVRTSWRSYLRHEKDRFDIIQMPLTDSYHPVGSGAFALGEDYRYTIDAGSAILERLKPDGILVLTRWLQETPSEWLRAFTTLVTVVEDRDLNPSQCIVALRGYNTGTLLVKPGGFTEDEMTVIRQLASDNAFDLVFGPGITEEDVNRFNILHEPLYYQAFNAFLEANPREAFFDDYPYDVQPATDDHPFYSHYFKWSQLEEVLGNIGITWQPFGGAGYLVVLVIFLLALLLSGVLILSPVFILRNKRGGRMPTRVALYFSLIGLAFFLVEMPLIQRFILYLDHPAFAFAAVLFSVLLFSGLGSRFGSGRFSLSSVFMSLLALLMGYSFLLPVLLNATLGWSFPLRLLITILLIAPLGFLMGIPFPAGLAWMQESRIGGNHSERSRLIAWVWAVNGASSVVASILASMLALSFGFMVTGLVGMGCYLLAAVVTFRQG